MSAKRLEVLPVTPVIGAEIAGVDLDDVDDSTFNSLRDALMDHGVLFFRDQDIAVVGGGDSAVEEATFLTRFGRSVTIIHRRDELRASKIMQDRAFANDKITFLWDTVVTKVNGESSVESISVENVKTGEASDLPISGLFVAIGHRPNTDLFKGQLELKENGYLVTEGKSSRTSVEGVFACGDVQDDYYRQAITAAGSGCMAAIDAERWLEDQH